MSEKCVFAKGFAKGTTLSFASKIAAGAMA